MNHWNYLRRVLKQHDIYLKGSVGTTSRESRALAKKAAEWITANQTEIKRLVERAKVRAPIQSVMRPIGYNFAENAAMNALDNLLFLNSDVLLMARNAISVAKGYYLTQAKLSLNPLHWIEVVLFLPKEILTASGIEITSKLMNVSLTLVQIIYWAALAAWAILGIKA